MDRQNAMLVLQALRPGSADASSPFFAEALALVERDPELKAWWEAQQAFDQRVTAKLGEVPLPADLRATLLASNKIVELPPQPRLSLWLAAAALVAILCVAGTVLHVASSTPLAEFDYNASVLPLIRDDAPNLAMISTDQNEIMSWLKERKAPIGTLPTAMTSLPTVGCQKYFVHGHTVSLVCFTMPGGGIAHLFMVEQKALADPPSNGQPEFAQIQGWSTAAWSDGKMSYLLATTAGPDALKQLL